MNQLNDSNQQPHDPEAVSPAENPENPPGGNGNGNGRDHGPRQIQVPERPQTGQRVPRLGREEEEFIQLGEATIHSQTGHIQIAKQGFWAARSRASDMHMIDTPDKLKENLARLPGLDQVVARVNFIGMLNNVKRDLGIIGDGIEPDGESKIGSFMHYIEGRALNNGDKDGMVIGQGIAKSLNLKIGDRITLVVNLSKGAINTMDFQIVGIFQSFSKEFDARAVRIPLAAAQELLDTHAVHLLVMTLQRTEDTDRIASSVKKPIQKGGHQKFLQS